MLPIDKNIPIPPAPKRGGSIKGKTRMGTYPWKKLLPGDSFLVPDAMGKTLGHLQSMAWHISIHCPYTFVVRKVDGGLRVWRE